MEMLDLLLVMAVAVPCGTIARLTSAYSKKGWFLHVGMAFMGGFVGVWFSRSVEVPTVYMLKVGAHEFPVIWALIGSVLMVAAIGLMIKPHMR
jgi:uncharacterized membrane protein YeaQ/YmgE (transglycosylase-associated protein family)